MSSPPDTEIGTTAASRSLFARLKRAWRTAGKTANLAIGVGDYEAYCKHQREQHPDQKLMSYAEYFRERQDARYGKGTSRCC